MIDFGKLNFSVSFNPTSAFPLDARYYFDSKTAADTAAAGAVEVGSADGTYYIGENIVVVENNAATMYLIGPDKTLAPVGRVYIGDDKTIVIDENNTIAIKGFEEAEANQQLRKNANGELEWFTPDNSTVDGLVTSVGQLTTDVQVLQDKVGNDGTDGEAKTGLYKEVDDVATDLADNYYDKTTIDGKVAGVFHFKGTATKYEQGNLYKQEGETEVIITDMREGDVYQILATKAEEDKEYVYTGTSWELLGFTVDLSNYATTSAMTQAISTAKTELQTYADGKATDATTAANAYTDGKITDLKIGDYAKTADVEAKISTAKTEAIAEAGTNADTKIADKVGEIGEGTVKKYVDDKASALSNDIKTQKERIDGLGSLASKSEVSETELAETLKTKINGKADKADTLAGYGITDAMTSTAITGAISTAKDEAVATAGTNADTKIKTAIGEIGESATVKDYVDSTVIANKYNDTAIKADIKSNTDAIAAINNETTGILATAKKYTDTEVAKKANAEHTHTTSEITGLDTKLGEIDTAIDGAKTYTDTEVAKKADKSHTHATSDITGLNDKLGEIDTKLNDRYTKTETNTAIQTAVANAGHLKRVIVTELPELAEADLNTIYMKRNNTSKDKNVYSEYMVIEVESVRSWEEIGDSAVDLTDYLKKTGSGDDLKVTDASTTDTLKNTLAKKANDADLATVAKTGAYGDLTGAPTKVSAFENDAEYLTATTQVQSDWNATSGAAQILNKPTLVQKQVITINKPLTEEYSETYKNSVGAYILDIQVFDKTTNERVLANITYPDLDAINDINNSFSIDVSNANSDLVVIVTYLGSGLFIQETV